MCDYLNSVYKNILTHAFMRFAQSSLTDLIWRHVEQLAINFMLKIV